MQPELALVLVGPVAIVALGRKNGDDDVVEDLGLGRVGGGEGIGRIKGNFQQAQKNPIREARGLISGPSPSPSQQIDPVDTGNTSDILSQKANQRFGLLVEKML